MEKVVPVFPIEDADRAETFYTSLGFEVDFKYQHEPGFPWHMGIKRGELYLHLSEHSKGEGPAEVYLFVDDVHAWVKMCEDAGIALHQPLEKKPWGNTEMMLVDPYGNGMRVAQLHTHDPA